MRLTVYGIPVPQGSMVKGRFGPIRHSNAEELLPWRESIAAEARLWLANNGAPSPLDGPVVLSATFYLPRPASAPKRLVLPTKRPDLDKLTRSIGDALSGLAYTDDARIVELHIRKRFAVDSPPRVEIFLHELTAEDAVA